MPTTEPTTGLDAVVAANVRALRARGRMRQSDLAERLGWARSTLAALEADRRRVSLADADDLCRVLGVSLAVLIDGAGPDVMARLAGG